MKLLQSEKHRQLLGVLLAFFASIMFSTKAVFVKLAYQYEIDAVSLLLLRMLFSLPFYIGIAIYASQKVSTYQPTRKDYWKILFLGVMGYYVASLLDFLGLQYITASLERLILFAYPTFVVLIGVFYFKEKINRPQIIALLLTYLGIVIIFVGNVDITSKRNLIIGSGLIFLCAVTFAVYIAGSGQLLPKLGTWRFTSYALIVSSSAVILHYLILNQGLGTFNYPYQIYVLSILMAIISTVIPTLLTSEGIRLIGSSNVAIVASVGPISTIVMAYFFLGERLSFIQLMGGVLVLFGVVFVSVARKKKKE
jgi:drug/metabolite transporter (DMT)-like permease